MQLSICDVTLWGLRRIRPSGITPTTLTQIASAIDSLRVDRILIPDRFLSEIPEISSAIDHAEIVIAVTDPTSLEEQLASSGLNEYSLRFLHHEEFPSLAGMHKFATEDCRRTECEIDFQSVTSPTQLEDLIVQGIDCLILVDRSGGLLPHQLRSILEPAVKSSTKTNIGCRFRHDMGVSVANSLTAIENGITHLDCSILGIGPYAGYTPLEEIATTIRIHSESYGCTTRIETEKLLEVNQLVSELLELPICPNKPVSGENIFATEAGIHQDGLLKNPDTYLPYRPELVGAKGIQLVIGRHSGKRAVAHRLEELGHVPQETQVLQVLELIKKLPKGEKVTDQKLSELFAQT
ncbi:MAG: hypothetical protein KDA65_09170 [Planctomycetaceae bacterium]|nr:hypothetical protein [Planctomycetaceae bacterium]